MTEPQFVHGEPKQGLLAKGMRGGSMVFVGCLTFIVLCALLVVACGALVASSGDEETATVAPVATPTVTVEAGRISAYVKCIYDAPEKAGPALDRAMAECDRRFPQP